jgi:hypothetical protein
MTRRNQDFRTIKSEGGLLPPDLLRRLVNPKDKLEGTNLRDYGLAPGERLNDAITQSWNKLRKHWTDFRKSARGLPEGEPGTSLTNEKWSVPLLRELGFGMLPTSAALTVAGKSYAINRFFGSTAVHLIGCQLDLDRRAKGVRGAATANPHGLVQDFLNRSEAHLWAILSNGLQLRILRDSQAISRQSFLEFDLEAMFDGEVYADFVVLWMVAHSTRFAARENERPDSCWLENWTKLAEELGTRALGDLRHGVEKALEALGQGFVGHPKNAVLRDSLRNGQLPLAGFHGQLLRIVYRLIFLFVAEDRTLNGLPLLHAPDESEAAASGRGRYAANYSAGRLRDMAGTIRGSRHGDLWWQLNLVFGAFSDDQRFNAVREQLALPVLGSFLWSPDSTAALNGPSLALSGGTELANADLLEGIRNLAFTRQDNTLRPVDYKNLGAEELGGVYESLLSLTPQVSGDGARFTFAEFAGNERKTSGSYYTPDSLVQCLLDSALEPAIEGAVKGKSGADAESAILALKVCDPAVGSGHFLVGAAHRLARHVARIRAAAQGEGEPSPGFYQHALRDVIGRCLYGVDINPMAAELCRVSLWLEALDPGKPLSFLDHHIRVGNSLMGTTPELVAGGLPDEAFDAIEGDDKQVCVQLKKRNKAEREGFDQRDLLGIAVRGAGPDLAAIAVQARALDITPDETADAVRSKADQFVRLVVSPEYKHAQQVADAWCSAFVWQKTPTTLAEVTTSGVLRQLSASTGALTDSQEQAVRRLSDQYQFFHWHIAFPEVFAKGGFDCVIGNPPWERVTFSEKEWAAQHCPSLLDARTASNRSAMLAQLEATDGRLFDQFNAARRVTECEKKFLRQSHTFPLAAHGDINTYAAFVELSIRLVEGCGRLGLIVPSGLATDQSTRFLFRHLADTSSLVTFYSFENEALIFPSIHHATKFCLLTASGRHDSAQGRYAYFARGVEDLLIPGRVYTLSAEDIARLNPNSGTCATFKWSTDADLSKHIYRTHAVFVRRVPQDNSWDVSFTRMLHMGDDSHLFFEEKTLLDRSLTMTGNIFSDGLNQYVPLLEAKMIHLYDHRFGTYEGQTTAQANQGKLPEFSIDDHATPEKCVKPHFWVDEREVGQFFDQQQWVNNWALGWRDVTSSVVLRTMIPAVVPRTGAGHPFPFCFIAKNAPLRAALLQATLSSFVFDYCVRQKIGGNHLTYAILEQLPVPSPIVFDKDQNTPVGTRPIGAWVIPRVLELDYTAWDLAPFAKDCNFNGPPFRWDEDRRFLIRAELDAALFHLYLPPDPSGDWVKAESESGEDLKRLKESFEKPRDAVDYIMETFPIVKKKDIEKYGDYRTKLQILEIHDEMQEAIATGTEYRTKLDPPPGDPRCCHPARKEKRH